MKFLNSKNKLKKTNDKKLEDMLNRIIKEQEKLKEIIINNNKVLMRRINILEEYNEISDMRHRNIYNELQGIKEKIY